MRLVRSRALRPFFVAALGALLIGHVFTVGRQRSNAGDAPSRPSGADGPPPIERPPNIVLIAIDTLRSDHLGCYGYHRAITPNIDRLAAEGVLFERCYSPASWTLPAFMSVFTGVHAQVHGCTHPLSRLPHGLPTLAERLRERGYFCGAVVSNPFTGAKYGFGRGFDRYDDYTISLDADMGLLAAGGGAKAIVPLEDLVTSPQVTREAVALLATARGSGKPFFLFVHYFDPHASYVPPAEYVEKFDHDYTGPVTGREPHTAPRSPPAGRDLVHLIALYDAEIAHNDHHLGVFLRELDQLPAAEQPLVVFMSDHGEAFGEHGMLAHGYSVDSEVISVPMIWRWPGVLPKGKRIRSPVSTLDVLPTLRDLLQLNGLSHAQGTPLWPGLRGGMLPADRVIFSEQANHGPMNFDTRVAVIRGDLRLDSHFAGAPDAPGAEFELHELSNDPAARKNLATSSRPGLAAMRAFLKRTWSECSELRRLYRAAAGTPERVDLDAGERQRINGLGYNVPDANRAGGKQK